MNLKRKIAFIAAVGAVALSAGSIPVRAASTIVGGGSSFMANITDICASGYNKSTLLNTDRDVISYSSVGSGSGKKGFSLVANAGNAPDFNLYKFAGSESAYSTGTAPTGFVYVPLIGGPIGIAYNLAGVTDQISLSSTTLAKIFAGTITKWNDAAIVADNTATTVVTPAVVTPAVTVKAVTQVAKSGITATIVKGATTSTITIRATKAAAKAGLKKSLVITRVIGESVKVVKTLKMSASSSVVVPNAVEASYNVSLGSSTIGKLTPDDKVTTPEVTVPAKTTTTGKTITLPATSIIVVSRSDTSGTSNMFANYLNKVEPTIWTKATNDAFSSAFPGTVPTDGSFQSASGNDGVSNYVKANNGSITYAELSYINERDLKAAKIKNAAGIYVAPTVSASADSLANADQDATGLVTQDYVTKTDTAYPINAVGYGIAATATSTNNTAIKGFFGYFLNKCAPASAAGAGYTALTGAFLAKSLAQVAKISAS